MLYERDFSNKLPLDELWRVSYKIYSMKVYLCIRRYMGTDDHKSKIFSKKSSAIECICDKYLNSILFKNCISIESSDLSNDFKNLQYVQIMFNLSSFPVLRIHPYERDTFLMNYPQFEKELLIAEQRAKEKIRSMLCNGESLNIDYGNIYIKEKHIN